MKLKRHPSNQELERWLSAADSGVEIDAHVATCDRCAMRLEALEEPAEAAIAEQLASLLAPPEDLTERLERRVIAKLDSRQVLGVLADLFGAGIETSRLLLSEAPQVDDN